MGSFLAFINCVQLHLASSPEREKDVYDIAGFPRDITLFLVRFHEEVQEQAREGPTNAKVSENDIILTSLSLFFFFFGNSSQKVRPSLLRYTRHEGWWWRGCG